MNSMYGTIFSLIPALVAIVLALITKEVFSSLFIGIITGGLFFSGFSLTGTIDHIFEDGMIKVLSNPDNSGILVFLVTLGIIVALMNKAGGSAAFGRFSAKHIKSRKGAQFSVLFLGCLIFIDDYFNCLTVGSVMKPVTDRHKISRQKLAYIIDATAAPICIIAPISSWAAAVSGFIEGEDGLALFVKAIPYNFYALLTLIMIIMIISMDFDFGPMNATSCNNVIAEKTSANNDDTNGKVIDLVFPVLVLVIFSVLGMIYTGGFFNGTDFVTAFSQSNAAVGLVIGGFTTIVITILFYTLRGVLSFEKCMSCMPEGFNTMVSPIMILALAWTLKAMTESLGVDTYIKSSVHASNLLQFLPAIIFVIGCLLAFATGTSWGTFGILIPIVVAIFDGTSSEMLIMSISACMAGAVCGDHCSPISDTSIMASAGAECEHMSHVTTQLPYALCVAVITFISYIIAGFIKNPFIPLLVGVILLFITLYTIKKITSEKKSNLAASQKA